MRSSAYTPGDRSDLATFAAAFVGALALVGCKDSRTRSVAPDVRAPSDTNGAPTRAEPSARTAREILSRLEGSIGEGARDAANPWAMLHGITAFGSDLRASDGRAAIDVVVGDFVRMREIDGRSVHHFPQRTDAGAPLEPHANLVIKTLLGAGVPLDRSFDTASGEKLTLARLVADAEWAFELPTDEVAWRRVGWTVSAFLAAHPNGGTIVTHRGPVNLAELVKKSLDALEASQQFLVDAKHAARPDLVEKRKQGIFAHPCGGFHLIQAVAEGALRSNEATLHRRLAEQIELVRFRWQAERSIYAATRARRPDYAWLISIQELKFFGHLLETVALIDGWDETTPSERDRAEVRAIVDDLAKTVDALAPAYREREKLRETAPQEYWDLIGDGCHAVRGLRLALVAFFEGR